MPARLLLSLALLLLVALGFSPAFHAGFVDYDDPAFVTQNSYVRSGITVEGLAWALTTQGDASQLPHAGLANVWHPLTWISHMIDAQIFGVENARGHHIHNLALHAGSTVLLFLIVLKLRVALLPAFVIAALFALHPLRVESVVWISERKDVLSGLFFFASLLTYVSDRRALSIALFIPALLAKPSVVVLPLVLWLIDWWRAGLPMAKPGLPQARAALVAKHPWLIPAALTTIIAIVLQSGGTQGAFAQPLTQRLLALPGTLFYYLYRTLFPFDLSFHYQRPAWPAYELIALVSLAAIAAVLYRLRKQCPTVIFGVLWFLALWLPASGIVHVGSSYTADRYTYLAHAGLFLGIIAALPRRAILATIPLVAACTLLSWQQSKVWHSSETLFTHGTRAQPNDPVSFQNLAALRMTEERFTDALPLLKRAIELSPRDHIALTNLAVCQSELGRSSEAESNFSAAISSHPSYSPAHMRLGEHYLRTGQNDLALQHIATAYRGQGWLSHTAAKALIGQLMRQGDVESAQKVAQDSGLALSLQ